MKIKKWDESEFGQMTFENICRLYSSNRNLRFTKEPPFIRAYYATNGTDQYAVRWNTYESHAHFYGGSNGCAYFVLSGECEITVDDCVYILKEGNYFDLPKCNYQFKVIGHDFFEYVLVCKLPADFPIINSNGDAFR